ncbi:hypothetical protein JCM19000A_41290 [Silvimonas sp. JCM 19000]
MALAAIMTMALYIARRNHTRTAACTTMPDTITRAMAATITIITAVCITTRTA